MRYIPWNATFDLFVDPVHRSLLRIVPLDDKNSLYLSKVFISSA
jgi:hypothetical protein